MARIPDEEIERLKKGVPIERLVMGFGIELKRHGAELIGLCPFHDDHKPSLVSYDQPDDLTDVAQGATLSSGLCSSPGQTRHFTYDSQQRLTSATNPGERNCQLHRLRWQWQSVAEGGCQFGCDQLPVQCAEPAAAQRG